jgi:hypothetical protein
MGALLMIEITQRPFCVFCGNWFVGLSLFPWLRFRRPGFIRVHVRPLADSRTRFKTVFENKPLPHFDNASRTKIPPLPPLPALPAFRHIFLKTQSHVSG